MWHRSLCRLASFASLSSSSNLASKAYMDVVIHSQIIEETITNHENNSNKRSSSGSKSVTVCDGKPHRITFDLFTKKCPVACENFIKLCTGENELQLMPSKDAIAEPSFKDQFLPQLTYRSSTFHRVCPGFLIQGGDVIGNSGTGQLSIYGETFDAPEETALSVFNSRGLLATAVSAPHLNHSQFFILTAHQAPHLNRSCICFGKVHSGWDVIEAIERVPLSVSGAPLHPVVIVDCGVL